MVKVEALTDLILNDSQVINGALWVTKS